MKRIKAAMRSVRSAFEWSGELAFFVARMLRTGFAPPYEWKELVRQMDEIGSRTLPVAALAGAALGAVLSMHTRESLVRFGAGSLMPAVVILSIVKETGPIITALVASGRVGAGIGAELGSMRATEQVDAMEVSAVDPFKFLVMTRVVACVLVLPLLTVFSEFFGIMTGWLANALAEPISLRLFLEEGFAHVAYSDFLPAALKTTVFGFIIGIIGCFQGLRSRGGTEGVGRSATSAVVLSSLLVILSDVVLVRMILIFA